MMQILKVSASNFLSFKTLEYTFPTSGLYFVGGDVIGRTISNSNGAGKSAFFEVLCFAFFGKTIRNADADRIVNRDVGKNCIVNVSFSTEEGEYDIIRSINDSDLGSSLRLIKGSQDLTQLSKRETQKLIDSTIGLDWLLFSTAIIFGEKARRFTEANDTEKKKIFDELIMLNIFDEPCQMVKDKIKELIEDMGEISSKITGIEAYLEKCVVDYSQLKLKGELFKKKEVDSALVSADINNKKKVLEAELTTAKEEYEKSSSNIEELNEEQNKYFAAFSEIRLEKITAISNLNDITQKSNVTYCTLSAKVSTLKDAIQAVTISEKGVRCPTCYSVVDEKSVAEVLEHLHGELDKLSPLLDEAKKKYEVALAEVVKITAIFDKKLDEALKLKSAVEEFIHTEKLKMERRKSTIREIENKISNFAVELRNIGRLLETEKEQIGDQLKELKGKIAESEKEDEELKSGYAGIELDIEYYKFWVEGFGPKGIKSFLLDEILPELNDEVSKYASVLLGDEMVVRFDTEATLKSGEKRDRFSVQILANDIEVGYETCSNGEKARIDISILLALQSLIFRRSVKDCNLVIFDEVFECLDIVGIENTVNLLKESSRDKAIFVISHQNELRDYFDNLIIIERKDGISELNDG